MRARLFLVATFAACATPPPTPSDAAQHEARPVVVERLDNGMTLAFVERPLLPQTTFAFFADVGAADDPAGARGRSRFAMSLLWRGHGTLDESAVQDAFDAIGGTSGTDVGVEQATVWLSCLSAHASEGLALLHGALTQPRFDADIVERERARALAVRSQSLYQPSYLAQESFVPALLGDHPYAAGLLLPDPEFLARVDRAQAVAAASTIVQPQLATLVVVGPRDDALVDAVRATFRGLPRGERERPPPPPAPVAPTQRDVRKIARPEMGQIYLRFGALGFAASAPQRAAVLVCQRLLASGFSSVLLDELRVNRGLVYGIGLSQAWLRAPSPYSFITSTKAEQTEEVLNVTFAKLREVQAGTFTDEQLTAARNTLLADTAAGLETQLGVAYEVHEGLRDAGDPDAWRKELAAIAAVTREDVRAIAGHYDPSRMTIVMVGTAEALARIDTSRIR